MLKMSLYSVDKVDVSLEMEQWAKQAALARAADGPVFPFPVRHPPYPHCSKVTVKQHTLLRKRKHVRFGLRGLSENTKIEKSTEGLIPAQCEHQS